MSSLYSYLLSFFVGAKSSKKNVPLSEIDNQNVHKTIEKLKNYHIVLEQREFELYEKINKYKSLAKDRLKNNDRKNAGLYLQNINGYENQLSMTLTDKFNNLNIISAMETGLINRDNMVNMQSTLNTLKVVSSNCDSDYINSLHNDIKNEMSKLNTVQSTLSSPIVNMINVESGLNELEKEIREENEYELDNKLLELPEVKNNSVRNIKVVKDNGKSIIIDSKK